MSIEHHELTQTQIERYTILGELGRGGMGVVYRAYEPALERTVALKVIAPQLAHEHDLVARLRHEAISAARLRHPNIALLYEFGHADDVAFLAMEYVAGASLRALLEAGSLSYDRALNILSQVGQALDYAHSMGIVHRDVKPSNILIGPGDHAVLIDFGLAEAAESSIYTLDGAVLGTPHYMAPEQAAGRAAEARSDQYALATVAYEMLVGVTPFRERGTAALLHAHLYDPPPRPSELRPSLPGPVDRVLLRALAKSPEERYPSLAAFVEDLRRALAVSSTLPLLTSWWRLAAVLAASLLAVALALWLPQLIGLNGGPPHVDGYIARGGVPLPQQIVWVHAPGLSGGTAVVVAGDTLVSGTLDGALLALRAESGQVRWRKEGDADQHTLYGAPSAGLGLIFVGRADEQVFGLSPSTGDPVWRRRVTGAVQIAPTLDGERLLVVTDKGYLYVLQAGSGQVLWSRPLAVAVQPPAAGSDRIFICSGRSLYALDARDGAVIWQFDAPSAITTSPVIAGDLVLVGTERGVVYSLQIVDAREVYHFQANGAIRAAPAFGAGMVYVADRSGGLTALRADSGAVAWHVAAGAAIDATPLLADGKLLFGATNGSFFAIDAQKGVQLARLDLSGSISSAATVEHGLIFVFADRIYALGS